jgi:3'-phosphoadenosine 5'-phosphosulfate sulfotransferase (PAPS reductase)/FAD synthetase
MILIKPATYLFDLSDWQSIACVQALLQEDAITEKLLKQFVVDDRSLGCLHLAFKVRSEHRV